MRRTPRTPALATAVATVLAAVLAGCGGGTGGTASDPVSGTAATTAPATTAARPRPLGARDHRLAVTVDGQRRRFLLHTPPGHRQGERLPLVIVPTWPATAPPARSSAT